jgi:hypothetical protein
MHGPILTEMALPARDLGVARAPPTLRWRGDRLWLGRRGEERQSDQACRSQGEGIGQHEQGGGLLTWSITSEAVKAVSDGSVPVMTVLLTVGGDDEEVLWHQG